MTVSRSIGTGAVGLRDAKPIIRRRPDLCADHGHPGVSQDVLDFGEPA